MRTVSKILSALAFAAFYQSCASGQDLHPGGVVLALILVLLSRLFWRAADNEMTARRDADAKFLVESALKGENVFFYLYLRPFSITNKLPLRNPLLQSVQQSL